jgi:hypothetical protein
MIRQKKEYWFPGGMQRNVSLDTKAFQQAQDPGRSPWSQDGRGSQSLLRLMINIPRWFNNTTDVLR